MDTVALRAPAAPLFLPALTPHALAQAIGTPEAPLLLDVRRRPAFDASDRMLCGAQYCEPDAVALWAGRGAARPVVVYCVHGHAVSAAAAATLAAAGWPARALAGGFEGGEPGVDAPADRAAWRATPPLSFRKRPDWGVSGAGGSRWITRERPKIDRIACPWLIRRFIDPQAVFLYAPAAQVMAQAAQTSAVAYDLPGAPVSHVGERCSFDALLEGFDLRDAALDRLALIVRGADTDRLDLAPESAGLLAVSLGLSRRWGTDDLGMLDAAMPVYDALYAWCRDVVAATNERHSWNPQPMSKETP
jgi:rhodanese-related sulfurtransferase